MLHNFILIFQFQEKLRENENERSKLQNQIDEQNKSVNLKFFWCYLKIICIVFSIKMKKLNSLVKENNDLVIRNNTLTANNQSLEQLVYKNQNENRIVNTF